MTSLGMYAHLHVYICNLANWGSNLPQIVAADYFLNINRPSAGGNSGVTPCSPGFLPCLIIPHCGHTQQTIYQSIQLTRFGELFGCINVEG